MHRLVTGIASLTVALGLWLSSCGTGSQIPNSMWNLPGPGMELGSLALEVDTSPLGQGSLRNFENELCSSHKTFIARN